jgi:hypothetical protein
MKLNLFNLYNVGTQNAIRVLGESKTADVPTTQTCIRLLSASKVHEEEYQAVVGVINERSDIKELLKRFEEALPEQKNQIQGSIQKIVMEELQKAELQLTISNLTFDQLYSAGLRPADIYALEWLMVEKQEEKN